MSPVWLSIWVKLVWLYSSRPWPVSGLLPVSITCLTGFVEGKADKHCDCFVWFLGPLLFPCFKVDVVDGCGPEGTKLSEIGTSFCGDDFGDVDGARREVWDVWEWNGEILTLCWLTDDNEEWDDNEVLNSGEWPALDSGCGMGVVIADKWEGSFWIALGPDSSSLTCGVISTWTHVMI